VTNTWPGWQIRTWQDAEHLAAAWLQSWGYTDARVTGGGADGGVDVRAAHAVAQVKFQAAQVGRPALQRLVGAAGRSGRQLVFFTGTGYSQQAIAYANEYCIALYAYSLDGAVTAVNSIADRIATAARPQGTPPLHRAAIERVLRLTSWWPPQGDWGLRANWRAAVGYLCLIIALSQFGSTSASAGASAEGASVADRVTTVVICVFLAGAMLAWHFRCGGGAWPPRRRRDGG
jgi:hypothetical protein